MLTVALSLFLRVWHRLATLSPLNRACPQAESLFTPEQYEATLAFVLERCKTDCKRLEQTLALATAAVENKKLGLALSRMKVMKGRPRLRDRIASVLTTDERKAQVDVLLDTWESYSGFCYKHQFPPTLSERIKARLYFLASQTRWDWQQHVHRVLPTGGHVLVKVRAHPITQPDLPVIIRVLESLGMDGAPPFPEMTAFRASCFQSFPVIHVQRMTLSQVSIVREILTHEEAEHGDRPANQTVEREDIEEGVDHAGYSEGHTCASLLKRVRLLRQILQLYTAAYQPQGVWKEAWKHLCGVISVQIIRDVEAFVSSSAFAAEEVMRFVVGAR